MCFCCKKPDTSVMHTAKNLMYIGPINNSPPFHGTIEFPYG